MKQIRTNIVAALAALVIILILLSTILVFNNREIMIRTTSQQELSEQTLIKADFILNNLQAIDLGLRAYAITQHPEHLKHYQEATTETAPAFDDLHNMIKKQNYEAPEFRDLRNAMKSYIDYCNLIIKAVEMGESEQVKEMISQDKGYEAWSVYQKFYKNLSDFERELARDAQKEYDSASSGSIWIMTILLTVSLPTLIFIVYLLRRAEAKRKSLFLELEENNRKYNFNTGAPIDIRNEYQLINGYIENSKKAAGFINQVAQGKFEVRWEGLDEGNIQLNQDNLAGSLVKMRDQMKMVKEEETKRQWVSTGLTQFSELIRQHQENIESLAHESLVYLVKYLKAQQGGLFIVREEDEKDKFLELAACYAFERKKYLNKKINIGEGLLGQAFQEEDTLLLTDLPDRYTSITSGLGDACPTCLLIVPMKYNGEVRAIIEIAGFTVFEPYQIEFMEKIGEFIASAVATVQTNEVTAKLLTEAQAMTEELKSQEEEMRQNMEELSATQEEMSRKEKEYVIRIKQLEDQLAVERRE